MLAHRFQFVKNFFQVFSNFFPIRSLSCRSRDSFDIISLHPYFVNTFFKENYFYFEIIFHRASFGEFPLVPDVSWPLYPISGYSMQPLRRGAFPVSFTRSWRLDAGFQPRTFIYIDRFKAKEKPHSFECGLCWRYLSSRAVTSQVLSALMSLTSVFGMGTGGPSSQSTPTCFGIHPENWTSIHYLCFTT